jgi:S1-C subfamily serine protease
LKDPAMVDKLARFVKASMKGWDWAVAHPDEAVMIVLKNDTTGAQTEHHQKQMMGEIAKLVGTNPKGTGWLDPAAYNRTVRILMSGLSAPVITKIPQGVWTHDVFDKAMAMRLYDNGSAAAELPSQQAPSQASTTSQQALKIAATGSGFYVSNASLLVTNYHVVEGCTAVSIPAGTASVVGVDPQNDLALLSAPPRSGGVAALRISPAVRAGERVVAVGFPLAGFLAEQANVTTGDVSSLAGIGNDSRYLQITAPVQPGNSGGPLFDAAGNVIGVVSAKLDAIKVAGVTGDIPENVNFALNVSVVRAFLDSRGITYETAASTAERSAPDIGDWGKSITQLIACWH